MATEKKRFQTYVNSELEKALNEFANTHAISQSKAIELILSNFLLDEDENKSQTSLMTIDTVKSLINDAIQSYEQERIQSLDERLVNLENTITDSSEIYPMTDSLNESPIEIPENNTDDPLENESSDELLSDQLVISGTDTQGNTKYWTTRSVWSGNIEKAKFFNAKRAKKQINRLKNSGKYEGWIIEYDDLADTQPSL